MARDKARNHVFDLTLLPAGYDTGQLRKRFSAGQTIYAQGDPADAIFFIESGWVLISVMAPSGKEGVVALRGAGECIGLRSLIEDRGRRTTASALTDCSALRLPAAAVTRMLREDPRFAETFVLYLIGQSIHDREIHVDLLTHSAEQRLARTLLRLANGGRGENAIPTRMTQTILAKMIGTTRSRVSFFMNRFKKQGLIDYGSDGRVRVLTPLRRAVLRGQSNP